MLKKKIASCTFNLKNFIEVMEDRGYITEFDYPYQSSLSRVGMEKTFQLQEEFEEVFSFFYPERDHDIEFECVATNEGFEPKVGAFSYALFNKKVIDSDEVKEILKCQNRQGS